MTWIFFLIVTKATRISGRRWQPEVKKEVSSALSVIDALATLVFVI
jgi:hypothetical protein